MQRQLLAGSYIQADETPVDGKRKSKRMAIAMAAVQPKPRG